MQELNSSRQAPESPNLFTRIVNAAKIKDQVALNELNLKNLDVKDDTSNDENRIPTVYLALQNTEQNIKAVKFLLRNGASQYLLLRGLTMADNKNLLEKWMEFSDKITRDQLIQKTIENKDTDFAEALRRLYGIPLKALETVAVFANNTEYAQRLRSITSSTAQLTISDKAPVRQKTNYEMIYDVGKNQDIEGLRDLLQLNINIDETNSEGLSAAAQLAKENNFSAAAFLIEKGQAKVNPAFQSAVHAEQIETANQLKQKFQIADNAMTYDAARRGDNVFATKLITVCRSNPRRAICGALDGESNQVQFIQSLITNFAINVDNLALELLQGNNNPAVKKLVVSHQASPCILILNAFRLNNENELLDLLQTYGRLQNNPRDFSDIKAIADMLQSLNLAVDINLLAHKLILLGYTRIAEIIVDKCGVKPSIIITAAAEVGDKDYIKYLCKKYVIDVDTTQTFLALNIADRNIKPDAGFSVPVFFILRHIANGNKAAADFALTEQKLDISLLIHNLFTLNAITHIQNILALYPNVKTNEIQQRLPTSQKSYSNIIEPAERESELKRLIMGSNSVGLVNELLKAWNISALALACKAAEQGDSAYCDKLIAEYLPRSTRVNDFTKIIRQAHFCENTQFAQNYAGKLLIEINGTCQSLFLQAAANSDIEFLERLFIVYPKYKFDYIVEQTQRFIDPKDEEKTLGYLRKFSPDNRKLLIESLVTIGKLKKNYAEFVLKRANETPAQNVDSIRRWGKPTAVTVSNAAAAVRSSSDNPKPKAPSTSHN